MKHQIILLLFVLSICTFLKSQTAMEMLTARVENVSANHAPELLYVQTSKDIYETGEATLSFHCSDINTEFITRVEGVGNIGLIGVGKCEFRVLRDVNN